jgi:hypothetical protein
MLIDPLIEATIATLEEEPKIPEIVASRERQEIWFQRQIYKRLTGKYPSLVINSEKPYPSPNVLDRCDFWCQEDDRYQSWIELKLCITNYLQEFAPSQYNRSPTHG